MKHSLAQGANAPRRQHVARGACLGAALSCVLLLAGCSTSPTAQTEGHPEVGYSQLTPPPNIERYQLQPGDQAIPPALREHDLPVYPPELVSAQASPATVVAQVVVDKTGRVKRVTVESETKPDPRHARFAAAVKAAVSQWRFYPYRVQKPGPNGTVSQVPLPVTLWYAFHFSVVDGKPVVGFRESRKTPLPR